MHSRWSRRVALGIVSVLTASFAFVGFVEGPSGATDVITQTSPDLGNGNDHGIERFHHPAA